MAAADNDDLSSGLETGIEGGEDTEDSNSSDGEAEGEADNEGERRRKKVQLTASASVPLFERLERVEVPGERCELGGSEVELDRGEMTQTALHLAQSYAGKYPEPGPGHGLHHKVQFANIESSPVSSSHHVSFSPARKSPSFDQRSPLKKKRRHRTFSENSTNLSMTSSANSVSLNTDHYVAPDGGFGWVVVAASFLTNMIADGVTFSFGIMFEEFQQEFSSSAAVTAGVVSVFHAVPLLTGPIATYLSDRFGCRAVTIWGSLLASLGFLAAAFSHHIALLYFFFGVVSGFGLSLVYVASIIIVAYYFETKRSFATGIAVSGSGIGTFLFAPFTQWLMDSYGGWRGACIILSGIFLNMILCGLMFKELEWKRRISRASSARSLSSPEIEELRAALQSGDVSELLTEEEEEVRIASSLVTIPTYIKDLNKLPQHILAMMVQNKQTYDFILENYPDCLRDIQSVESFTTVKATEEEADKEKHSNQSRAKSEGQSKSVKLKRRVSSMIRGQHKAPEPALSSSRAVNEKVDLQKLKVRRQSMTYRGATLSTRHRLRSSSCPDIYKTARSEEDDEEESCSGEMLNYITLPFIVFCISNFLLYFWYDVPYVYTIEYVENNLNIPNTESTQILSIIGILNTVGEVAVGWLSDQKWVSSLVLYAVCMLVCGLVTAIIPFISSFSTILTLSAVYGFAIAANYSLTSPILVDLVSIQQFSAAYGLLLAAQGIGNLIGPPFAGWLYDHSKQWFLTFGLCGIFVAVSGLCLLVIPAIIFVKKSYFKLFKTRECNGNTKYSHQYAQEALV